MQSAYGRHNAGESDRGVPTPSHIYTLPSRATPGAGRFLSQPPLPLPPLPLLGREQELQTLTAMLRRTEVRLFTLTGPGGVGKTRLLIAVAHGLLDDFADGVCFFPLGAISDPDFVLPTIAHMLGLRETGARSPLEQLQAALEQQSLLLLLDNFEQVLSAAPGLAELLSTCPHLHLLVTSRAALRIQGEHEFAVAPLPLPDLKRVPAHEAFAQNAAITLFVQRAQAIKPDFQVTQANARSIAEVCIRLDGLPLALELAAARTRLLSPQALLARLSRRLEVLTGGARDLPVRQQTLRATISWSYHLLAPQEQRLFRYLAVFAEGCTLPAAEAIAQAAGLATGMILDGVSALLENHLLRADHPGQQAAGCADGHQWRTDGYRLQRVDRLHRPRPIPVGQGADSEPGQSAHRGGYQHQGSSCASKLIMRGALARWPTSPRAITSSRPKVAKFFCNSTL